MTDSTIDNTLLSLSIFRLADTDLGDCDAAINCKTEAVDHGWLAINCTSEGDDALQSSAGMGGAVIEEYIQASLADNTKKAYQSDLSAFTAWGGVLPATAASVAEYLAFNALTLLASTLHRKLIALRKAHAARGFEDPTKHEIVRSTLRGIRRLHGAPVKQATPILREDLFILIDSLSSSNRGIRDRALLLLGFAGGFRRSELTALCVEDLCFVPEGLLVHLRRSKTDQEGEGRKVGIPYGRTRACPVKAIRAWLEASGIVRGPLLRGVGKAGTISSVALSSQSVGLILKKCAVTAGLSCEGISAHSLRAGLVTSAAKAGVSSWKIRQQTGHRSEAMLQRYIRDADIFTNNAAGVIL